MLKLKVVSIDVGASNYGVCACTMAGTAGTDAGPVSFDIVRLESWCLGDRKAVPASFLVDRVLEQWQQWTLWQEQQSPHGVWRPDRVVIEQQMRGAHVNLALAFATYAYFKLHHPAATVKFVPPAAKFKAYRKAFPGIAQAFPDASTPSAYHSRKRRAVAIADAILRGTNQPSLLSFGSQPQTQDQDPDHVSSSSIKKDDLADALLQAFCAL